MTNHAIKAAFESKANSDLRRASRETEILIGQTKIGTIRLQKQAYGYGIFWAEVHGAEIIAKAIEGKTAFIRETLINLYQVA